MTTQTPETWSSNRFPLDMCYEVWLYEADAMPLGNRKVWEAENTRLLAAMRDAGVRSSRQKLKALQQEWNNAFAHLAAGVLQRCCGGCFLRTRASALARALASAQGADVLAWDIGDNHARILLALTGEAGVADLVAAWQDAVPGVVWTARPFVRSVSAADASATMRAILENHPSTEAEAVAQTAAAPAANGAFGHITVLLDEAVEALQPAEGKVVVDATLGGGGHSERLIQAGASVWGIDQDPEARDAAQARLSRFGSRFHALAGNFRRLPELLAAQGIESVDGILADIGVSSHQLNTPGRGFSFREDGPLDMRMNPLAGPSAADLVNSSGEEELADLLWRYGEERASRAIARRIAQERAKAPITTTTRLAEVVASVLPRKGRQHPATRSFQALRIAVNDELGALEDLLQGGMNLLAPGGRMAIITFHSLEDRAVKRFFDTVCRPEIDRPEWPAPRPNPAYAARLVFRKPVTPSDAEMQANPRARSAKLRAIEKLPLHA